MKVFIEEYSPVWLKTSGAIEVPDDLSDEELIDYLNEEYATFIETLWSEVHSTIDRLDPSQTVRLPDGRELGW